MRLPDEILAEIFGCICVFPFVTGPTDPPIISKDLPQYTLQLVCKAWRGVVLSRPRLWSVVCLGAVFEPPTAAVLTRQAKLLDLWLSRSKLYLLEVILFFVHVPKDGDENMVAAESLIIGKVLSVADRMRSLTAQCHCQIMLRIASVISASPSNLAHLFLHIPRIGGDADANEPVCAADFPSSTKLEGVAIQGYLRLRKWDPGVQRTALKTFIYQPYFKTGDFTLSLDNLYELFVSCPALQNVMVLVYNNLPFQKTVQGKQREQLFLNNLDRLRISAFDPTDASEVDVGPLLDVLTIPYLEDLHLMGTILRLDVREGDGWNHLSEFLKRSDAPIRRCSFFGVPIPSEHLVECLEMLPLVTELELAGISFDKYVVSRLCWNPDLFVVKGGNILPRLTRLTVGGCSTRFSSVAEIVHMVHSRTIVPEYVDDEPFHRWMELWDYLPGESLSFFTLNQSGLFDENGPSTVGEELAKNPLINSYVGSGALSFNVLG